MNDDPSKKSEAPHAPPKGNQRLDQLLFDQGLAESRTRAQALIMAGRVLVAGQRVDKPGQRVSLAAEITVKASDNEFVSRGALKLGTALEAFGVDPTDAVVLDVGISTGGFSDLLLQRGARKVFGVDVGKGQVAWKLRNDPRVVLFEECNFRHFDPAALGELVDLVVMDVSFISLRLLLPVVQRCVKPGAVVLPMVKPQFELGPAKVGKGGVVREEALRMEAVEGIRAFAVELGFECLGFTSSNTPGPKGNLEYFLHLRA
jgi:23S rRNA (cytidine1920-2'-O)/16S rRNA (cytidine1409-2'-O)-methyltransferase